MNLVAMGVLRLVLAGLLVFEPMAVAKSEIKSTVRTAEMASPRAFSLSQRIEFAKRFGTYEAYFRFLNAEAPNKGFDQWADWVVANRIDEQSSLQSLTVDGDRLLAPELREPMVVSFANNTATYKGNTLVLKASTPTEFVERFNKSFGHLPEFKPKSSARLIDALVPRAYAVDLATIGKYALAGGAIIAALMLAIGGSILVLMLAASVALWGLLVVIGSALYDLFKGKKALPNLTLRCNGKNAELVAADGRPLNLYHQSAADREELGKVCASGPSVVANFNNAVGRMSGAIARGNLKFPPGFSGKPEPAIPTAPASH